MRLNYNLLAQLYRFYFSNGEVLNLSVCVSGMNMSVLYGFPIEILQVTFHASFTVNLVFISFNSKSDMLKLRQG